VGVSGFTIGTTLPPPICTGEFFRYDGTWRVVGK
jgi:hypothetical protein